jgi:EAL domain-containing protein (putative c-di-GMP-specific phosphodiesterase class I)
MDVMTRLKHESAGGEAVIRYEPARRYNVALGRAYSDERHRRFSARVQNLCNNGTSSVALFVIELPGLLEIIEVFGEAVKSSLVDDALYRLASQFGSRSVSCFGDDRLAVVCEEVLDHQVIGIAGLIQACIGRCRSISGVMIVGTPLIGMALHMPQRTSAKDLAAASIDTLIRRAELALSQASPGHDGSIQIYTQALDRQLHDATWLRQSLLRAIKHREFTLAYQPIVNLRDDRTSGLEALIRWTLPCGGQSEGPATFIPAAESAGLIVAIGAQILESAMVQASSWHRAGFAAPRIAVNVSGQQLHDPTFLATVEGSLLRAGLAPQALELELTERTLIESVSGTIRLLEYLQGLGVIVSVDDFGTGYSSLRYLQDLPISKLKIDRAFINRLTDGAREQVMVQSMISLAEGFGLGVVAEGIETPEQLSILRRLGCSHGQGYLFSHPVGANDAVGSFGRDWSVDRLGEAPPGK